jgi:hypothetical protein
MFDVSNLVVERISKAYNPHEVAIDYKYKNKRGLAYVAADDELGAYQGLLKQLEERYGNE